MIARRFTYISTCCLIVWLCATSTAMASKLRGQVTFNDFPVPGATITVTQGVTSKTAVTDPGGVFTFTDLTDGPANVEIEMQCFASLHEVVEITAHTPSKKWELALLPLDQLMARTKLHHEMRAAPRQVTPTAKRADAASSETPKTPDDVAQKAADGFLVNGSVNNAATSQYSIDPAFGNRRPGDESIYTGGAAIVLGNSALDARPYAISGVEAPKPAYNHVTASFWRAPIMLVP